MSNLNSNSHKKFERYIQDLYDRKSFNDEIVEIRRRFDIPVAGYPQRPVMDCPPLECACRDDSERFKEFMTEVKKLSKKYHISLLDGVDIFSSYIYYNSKELVINHSGQNLCMCADLKEEYEDPFEKDTIESWNDIYPIAVRISPYASKRDILDFVEKTFKHHIEPLQKLHRAEGVTIGKSRKRDESVQERNDFIYSHEDKSIKEIRELVSEKYGFDGVLDDGHISKILQIERKRRQ